MSATLVPMQLSLKVIGLISEGQNLENKTLIAVEKNMAKQQREIISWKLTWKTPDWMFEFRKPNRFESLHRCSFVDT